MKKVLVMLLLATFLISGTVGAFADAVGPPGWEDVWGDAATQKTIATFTIKFLYPDGSGGSGTYDILEQPGESHDKTIEDTLKGIHTSGQTHVYAITHVNGVPIEKTKWAKYGGPIKHVTTTPTTPPAPSNEVYVFIEGNKVIFPDQQPYIKAKEGRTMVPMRSVFEHYLVQAEVQWIAETRTVIAKDRTGKTVIFRIGDKNFDIIDVPGGPIRTVTNDVAPEISNGRTMLPLRALAEALNFQVDWIAQTRVVDIKEKPGNDRKLMEKSAWEKYVAEFNEKEAAKARGEAK